MGIYCDDSSADVFVFGNVFYKMETKHGILFTNSGWDLTMKNNIIIEPTDATAQISAHYYTWAAGSEKSMFGEEGLIRARLTKSVSYTTEPYTSEVFKKIKGFEPVPFDKMGLYKNKYRN